MINKNIVLIHGWGANVQKLQPLSDKLKGLGWDVFIPKMPGFDTPSPNRAWDVSEFAIYVFDLIKKRFPKQRYYVFGHSFGGMVATRIYNNYDRKNVEGITLCATNGVSRPGSFKRIILLLLAKIGRTVVFFKPLEHFLKKVLYKLARQHDYEKLNGVARETFKKVISEDIKPLVKSFKIPVLILWGQQDKMTKISDAERLNQIIRYSKLVKFQNEGHRLPYNRTKEIAEAIDNWATSK